MEQETMIYDVFWILNIKICLSPIISPVLRLLKLIEKVQIICQSNHL